jgi:1-acyl-sn-glycerol-3-phosphate acyltransferase
MVDVMIGKALARLRKVLIGTYTYLEFVLVGVVFLPVMAVSWLRHRRDLTRRGTGRWMRRFGRTTARLTPIWRFTVDGDPPADILRRAYVVIANHQSVADPFLLSFLPWDMRWVSKAEIFRLPLVGQLMRLGGDIELQRGDRDSVLRMLDECRRTLDHGCPIMMFPEGTRSKDGELLPFKDGAFELAIRAGVPVLPVVLWGTASCMVKGSPWLGESRARARVLPPISTAGMGPEDVARLRESAREAIAAGVRGLRADHDATPATTRLEPAAE